MVNHHEEVIEEHIAHQTMKQKINDWFKQRRKVISQRESSFVISFSLVFLLALCAEWIVVIPGLPTGFGIIVDYLLLGGLYTLALILAFVIIRSVLALFYLHRIGSLLTSVGFLIIQSLILMLRVNWGWKVSSLLSAIIIVATAALALLVGYMYAIRKKSIPYIVLTVVLLFLVVGIGNEVKKYVMKSDLERVVQLYENVLLGDEIAEVYGSTSEDIPATDNVEEPSMPQVWSLDRFAVNPAEPGEYQVKHYDYRTSSSELSNSDNGSDDIIYTKPMDGSNLLKDWSWTKEMYWGFTQDQIPINGQIWTPQGNGPFPIVFIMHGNHLSEEDSSNGYAYLGELLASHGMIVCSIDANFLNYSVWSGIVDDDQLLRSWLMLAHMTSFYEQKHAQLSIDWDDVALIGHSRGGQAAAMAVDAKQWLGDQHMTQILDKVSIKAVVGIAPTDYSVDNKQSYLKNVNYLTLHGTMDADLTESFGDRQFERTKFSEEGHFKATVELYHGNHGQFNTVWGKYDEQFPGGLALNTADLLSGHDQRLAAQIFINSFLLVSLKDQDQYQAIFQDYRTVGQYLPLTGYVTRYSSSNEAVLYDFEQINSTSPWQETDAMKAEVIDLKGGSDGSKQNKGLMLQWLGEQQHINFELSSQQQFLLKDEVESITISVAQAEYRLDAEADSKGNTSSDESNNKTTVDEDESLVSIDAKSEDSSIPFEEQLQEFEDVESLLRDKFDVTLPIELELYFADGETFSVDLSTYYNLLSPAENDFTKLGLFEDNIKNGKYDVSLEPLLQTYIIPVTLLDDQVKNMDFTDLERITLNFKQSAGSLIIDNIGVITRGGTYVNYSK